MKIELLGCAGLFLVACGNASGDATSIAAQNVNGHAQSAKHDAGLKMDDDQDDQGKQADAGKKPDDDDQDDQGKQADAGRKQDLDEHRGDGAKPDDDDDQGERADSGKRSDDQQDEDENDDNQQ